jgi:moderate conductance mechanosensitive channel
MLRLSILFSCFLLPAWGVGTAAETQPDGKHRLEQLVTELEDPAAREKLLNQLRLLSKAQAESAPANDLDKATTGLLRDISTRISALSEAAFSTALGIQHLPQATRWVRGQFENEKSRAVWLEALLNISIVLAAGYLVYFVSSAMFRKAQRAVIRKPRVAASDRIIAALAVFLFDLLPIVLFAIAAYFALTLVDAREQTRLAALAWIHASILVRFAIALARLFFVPESSQIRLVRISDESAYYGVIWTRRVAFIAIYGYFALQAGLLLGLDPPAHLALLHLLGMLLALLFIVLVAQNRAFVANLIRGAQTPSQGAAATGLRRRIAPIWHWLAIMYIVMLYMAWSLSASGGFLWLARATLGSALVAALGFFALHMLRIFFERGFRVSKELSTRYPGLEHRANRYIPVLHTLTRALVLVLMVLALLQAWGADTLAWLLSDSGRVLSGKAITIGLILLASFFFWELGNGLIERFLQQKEQFGRIRVRTARLRTLLTVGKNALRVLILLVTTLMVLAQLNVDITPLLAGAGVLGVALGFGSQKLVQDVINGAFILFDDTISVGDVADVGGKSGLVEAISIRNVRLRDTSGTVHTIPFSAISTISNMTKDFSYYVLDVGVGYDEDIDQVIQVLKDIGTELQQDPDFGPLILEPVDVMGLNSFDSSSVTVKARIKTLPIKQWAVGREFNRRMKKRFDELDIEIPYPHMTLVRSSGKQEKRQSVSLSSGDETEQDSDSDDGIPATS